MGAKKKAKIAYEPNPKKQAKVTEPKELSSHISWRFSSCDKEGPFAWFASDVAKYREVIEKLYTFETMTETERAKTGSHNIEIHKLSPAAKKRLQDIKRDDIDGLMSFRVAGTNRVMCVREGNVMKVLWFDPDHQVCPSLKGKLEKDKARRRLNNA